ncbi:MAG TPA: GntR family transcriptional regulator [Halomonas sp.]|nr:GntR family transcriptional regulator [Halomonas sp.]
MVHAWPAGTASERKDGERISDQQIVEQVRHAVLMQRLPPGTRLPEVTLCEVFGVSRSVVRKALTRLASNHVVDQRPNQVCRVRAPGVEETRETFDARRLVEGEVVALLAGELSASAMDALEKLARLEIEAFERGDETARIEHSLSLHFQLAKHSPNRVLGNMLTDLVLRTSIVVALYKRAGLASCYLEGDHVTLLALLKKGDAQAARMGLHHHLDNLEALLELSTGESAIDLKSIFGQVV